MSTLDENIMATLTPDEQEAMRDDTKDPVEHGVMRKDGADGDDDADDADDEGGADAPPQEGKGAAPAPPAPAPAPTPVAAPTPAAAPAPTAASQTPAPSLPDAPPAVVRYEAKLPENFDEQVQGLAGEEAALKAKFKAGELEFEEFDTQRSDIQTRRDALNRAQVKAEIGQEMTTQSAEQQWRYSINRFMASAAKEEGGIDYAADAEKNADLDGFVRMLAGKPENNDKSMDWFLSESHRRVKALHGITTAPAPAPAPPDPKAALAKAKEDRKVDIAGAPATLAQVPGGDGPGDVAGEFADLDALEGEALEAAIARMAPVARDRYLRGL